MGPAGKRGNPGVAGLPGAQGPPGFKVRHLLIHLDTLHPFCLGTNYNDIDCNADQHGHPCPKACVKMEFTLLTFLGGSCPKLEPDVKDSWSRSLLIQILPLTGPLPPTGC